MKLSQVKEGVRVEHVRQNQGGLKKPVTRKVGVVTTEELFFAHRATVAEMVEVKFTVNGRSFHDRVRYNKLKVLAED